MVGARLFHRFGLGLFDEGRVGQPPFERFRLLGHGFQCLAQPCLFGGDVDNAFKRQHERRLVDHDLQVGAFGRGLVQRREADPRQPLRAGPEAIDPGFGLLVGVLHEGLQSRTRRDAEFVLGRSDAADQIDPPFGFRLCRRIDLGLRRGPLRNDQVIRPIAQRVPQLFGDEGHERVQHHQDLVEHPACDRARFGGLARVALGGEHRLDQLQIPVAELVPDEVIDRVRRRIEAQVGKRLVERGDRLHHLADDPAVDRERRRRRGDRCARADAVRLAEARGVPQLGREVAIALDPPLIHLDVAALAFHRRHEEAQRIRAIAVDQPQRIDRIALGLGHFRAIGGADQPVQIQPLPGGLPHEMRPHHRHARIPEEQDVEPGDQQVVGIMLGKQRGAGRTVLPVCPERSRGTLHHLLLTSLDFARDKRRWGGIRPAQRRERPQRGGKPGVEDIGIAFERHAFAGERLRFLLGLGDIALAVRAIPGRDPVPPPQLP